MTNKDIKISQVCRDCGLAANYLTCQARYGAPPLKPCFEVSTFHLGECEFCERTNILVTEARDFFYPDFTLLRKAIKGTRK